jgi:hypothetical protein
MSFDFDRLEENFPAHLTSIRSAKRIRYDMPDTYPSQSFINHHPHIDIQELLNIASRIRGKPCHCIAKPAGEGSFSFTVAISFSDGIEWIAKFPRLNVFRPDIQKLVLESEVATLQLVRERTTIPVPEVFAWNSSEQNPVGSAYIIMSRASGRLLKHCGWYPFQSENGRGTMTEQQRCKIYCQLGRMIHQLSLLRFPKIGSIFRRDNAFYVGECLRIQTVEYGRADRGVPRGPFLSAMEYYSMLADVQAEEICNRPDLYIGIFFDRFPRREDWPMGHKDQGYLAAMSEWNERAERGAETLENKLDFKIFAEMLREMISDMEANDSVNKEFPLEHGDLSTQNIFVDTDFNITCIIDWALCSTVPLATLITHPPLPSRSCVVGMLEQEVFEHSFRKEEEKVDSNCSLTTLLRASHLRRDFDRFLHKDDRVDDYSRFEALFKWKYGVRGMEEYFAERRRADHFLRTS